MIQTSRQHIFLKIVIFSIFFIKPLLSFAIDCHPPIDENVPQYIIGYGSLMDETSKKRTVHDAGMSYPVEIKGFKRTWGIQGGMPGFNTTFLTVFVQPDAYFNGVVFVLKQPRNVLQYDERESIYCRIQVEKRQLTELANFTISKGQVWLYYSNRDELQLSDQMRPIVQSYVDIFMRGCIEIEEKFNLKNFATHCVLTTGAWSKFWVNDRLYPRRSSFDEPLSGEIDAILKELLPDYFSAIKIE